MWGPILILSRVVALWFVSWYSIPIIGFILGWSQSFSSPLSLFLLCFSIIYYFGTESFPGISAACVMWLVGVVPT